ncbi:hypothetical protein BDN72DRAFT_834200 [Pluteus cervinus]|uniref:Uncharacterized protein n=1 Tax=Pluteus cervinus TaxID=181527 RepID=A0ACD3BA37_9AGAR|nr:hypothetical protein BDN72DRAFT_834200 [Pluteus cervinus]
MCDAPRLPLELEREIFTVALRQQPRDARNLFLVARRVAEWLNPVFYGVVSAYTGKEWPPSLSLSQIEPYAYHVRHLNCSQSLAVPLLQCCPNISNLAVWTYISRRDFENVLKLPIRRLSIKITKFFKVSRASLTFWSRITHLDVSNRHSWDARGILPHFRALTHLAMFADLSAGLVEDCLLYGKGVKALLLLSDETGGGKLLEVNPSSDEDLRIIRVVFGYLYIEDWQEGAWGRMDMWAFADEVIKRRQKAFEYST